MTTLHSSGFFVMRTARLAFDELIAWSEGGDPRAGLRDRFAPDEIADALAVAMPDLLAAVGPWLADPARADSKLEAALVRVLARMAGRATPFGLFAGWSTGLIGAPTRLELSGEDRPHSRLDMDCLEALVDRLGRDPAVRAACRYQPTPGLYRAGDRLRYVEVTRQAGGAECRLVAVEPEAEVLTALERAGEGATRAELALALAEHGASADEAADFVDELIDAQLLVPDLALGVTGPEPAGPLGRLLRSAGAEAVGEAIEEATRDLAAADAAPAGRRAGRTAAIERRLAEVGMRAAGGRLVQVDLHRTADGLSLAPLVLEELRRGIEVLRRLAPWGEPPDLRRFRERFTERYGDAEVPLAEALDPEAGLGFGAEAPDASRGGGPEPGWGAREQVLLGLVLEARRPVAGEPVPEVRLDLERLAPVLESPAPLPGAFAAMAAIAACDAASIERGDFDVRLINVGGPSGANLLGRFCHADPDLRELVEQHLRDEEEREPDAVFAEIAHLPEGRTGNVLLRPRLREHEIVLLAGSSAPPECRITLAELVLCLEGGELVLRSPRLGRRVIPRMTTAHNFHGHGVGLYRFLAMLREQGVAGLLAWDWGPLAAAPFTPRVRHRRTLLALARWTLRATDLERLAAGDVDAWREDRGVPRWVGLESPDAPLPLDLANPLAVDALVGEARRRGAAALVEWWPGADRMPVRSPRGRHVHELLVPFTLPAPPARNPPRRRVAGSLARTVPPGSGWLYAKLYTAPAVADRILVEGVGPLARQALAEGAARDWHFLRYADPDFHLRVRFAGDPDVLRAEVQPAIEALAGRLIGDRLVWRLVFDTYEREVERYGGPDGIGVVETIFTADSDAVLGLLAELPPGEASARERWRVGAAGALALIGDLGVDAAGLVARLRAEFGAQERIGKEEIRRMAAAFRADRPHVEPLVDAVIRGPDGSLPGWLVPLRRRAEAVASAAAELHDRGAAGRLNQPVEHIAGSLVHMHLNRLLRQVPRRQELAVYDTLDRLLAGRAARVRERASG